MSKAYDERGGQDECQKFARYNCMIVVDVRKMDILQKRKNAMTRHGIVADLICFSEMVL